MGACPLLLFDALAELCGKGPPAEVGGQCRENAGSGKVRAASTPAAAGHDDRLACFPVLFAALAEWCETGHPGSVAGRGRMCSPLSVPEHSELSFRRTSLHGQASTRTRGWKQSSAPRTRGGGPQLPRYEAVAGPPMPAQHAAGGLLCIGGEQPSP